ncbi:MAG: ABC transporter substrate-binding protein [Gloeobacterales cyanobacterium]
MTRLLPRLFLALLLPSLLLTACSSSNLKRSNPNAAQATPVPAETLTLGFSAWPGWFPWQVAEDAGLFKKNGLNVKLTWFPGYLDSINALTAGKLDANSMTLNDTVSAVAGGADLVVVLANDNSTGNDQIIVRDGIKSIKDLKGKKVAAELGTVDHYLLLLGLAKAGMTQKDIIFQPMETGAAAAAFAAGNLDAVGAFTPFTSTALKRPKSEILFTSKDFPGAIPDHLVVSRKLLQERPADVQKLIDTWFETLEYIKDNPEEAVQIMAKRGGISPAEYREYDAGTRIFTLRENLAAFAPGNDTMHLNNTARTISDFLLKSGLTKKPVSTQAILDPTFVKAAAQKKGIS